MIIGDEKIRIMRVLHLHKIHHGTEVISEVQVPRRANSRDNRLHSGGKETEIKSDLKRESL